MEYAAGKLFEIENSIQHAKLAEILMNVDVYKMQLLSR